MTSCIIAIPIYNENLDANEQNALKRVFQVDHGCQIIIFAPENINLSSVQVFLCNRAVSIKYFKKKYFSSVHEYSRLLLSPFFYKAFLSYEYILIYQLDAFIFQSNLFEWCNKDYDYIGAPWFETSKTLRFYSKMLTSSNPLISWIKRNIDYNRGDKIFVGNGGLSLRKVKSFYNISKWLPFIEPNIFKYNINEDFVWSILVTKYFKNFRVPGFEEALRFSVEENPKESLELLGEELPFGCHAWGKHDIGIWRPIFDKFGYKI